MFKRHLVQVAALAAVLCTFISTPAHAAGSLWAFVRPFIIGPGLGTW